MSVTGVVENGVVKMPAEVPDGTEVEVLFGEDGPRPSPEEFMAAFRELQAAMKLTPEAAEEWIRQVKDARR